MNIQNRVYAFALLCAIFCGYANQINMRAVRKIAYDAQKRAEHLVATSQEQDIDIVDIDIVDDLDAAAIQELKPNGFLQFLNRLFTPFLVWYNKWQNSRN